jgi:L-threonylcarbamoyladenylate synthase
MARAKDSLNRSGLVVIPTDTVYGLAADAFDPTGVRRLLRAKGRGRDMPTPVLLAGSEVLTALATGVTVEARELAEAFWPGGLTLIFRQQASLRWDLGDSRGTVAVRVPAQDDALALLGDTGPLAVSSANTTGMPAATTIEQAQEMLADAVDVYLDAGPTPGPLPSTIVDATTDILVVRRLGVVDIGALREVVGNLEVAEPG